MADVFFYPRPFGYRRTDRTTVSREEYILSQPRSSCAARSDRRKQHRRIVHPFPAQMGQAQVS